MSTAAWTIRPATSTFTYPKAWGFHGESDGTAPFENTRDFCDRPNIVTGKQIGRAHV